MKKIVVFEDNGLELEQLEKKLNKLIGSNQGFSDLEVKYYSRSSDLFKLIEEKPSVNLFILDIFENGKNVGLDILDAIKLKYKDTTHVIINSNSKSNKDVVAAVKRGADHYLVKGFEEDELELALECYLVEDEADQLVYNGLDMVGETMIKIKDEMPALIESTAKCVFVHGETGSGKEMVAEIIKGYLPAAVKERFVTVNCSQLKGDTVLSELFGHKKGSFTGADKDKAGLIESASGSWLFLDEIAELSLEAQAMLLRAIENQTVKRVGANKEMKINVRFIAATKENLPKRVKMGLFREDLWNRINQIPIEIPALKDRKSEIPVLAKFLAKNIGDGTYQIPKSTMILLQGYEWRTGNVRELKNCLVKMTVKAGRKRTLSPAFLELNNPESSSISSNVVMGGSTTIDFRETQNFKVLSLKLFHALLKYINDEHGELSSVKLSNKLGISRTYLANMKAEIDKRIEEETSEDFEDTA